MLAFLLMGGVAAGLAATMFDGSGGADEGDGEGRSDADDVVNRENGEGSDDLLSAMNHDDASDDEAHVDEMDGAENGVLTEVQGVFAQPRVSGDGTSVEMVGRDSDVTGAENAWSDEELILSEISLGDSSEANEEDHESESRVVDDDFEKGSLTAEPPSGGAGDFAEAEERRGEDARVGASDPIRAGSGGPGSGELDGNSRDGGSETRDNAATTLEEGEIIRGTDGNDRLVAGPVPLFGDDEVQEPARADTLDGGNGNDQLSFSAGDQVTGGAGADIFAANDWSDEGDNPSSRIPAGTSGSVSRITDFVRGEDRLEIGGRENLGESDLRAYLASQTVTADGVMMRLDDGSSILLQGLTEPLTAADVAVAH